MKVPATREKGPGRFHRGGKSRKYGKPVGYIKHLGPLVPAPASLTFGHRNGG